MAGKQSILIVDDDEGARRSLRLIFEKKGYETEQAATGAEALAKARGRFFNVVLLDIRLPDIEGVDLVRSFKKMHPDIVVIMSTAHATVENAVRALNEGASAYVTKPLDMDRVLATIAGVIEKQMLLIENKRLYDLSQRELAERRQAEAKLKETLAELGKSHEDLLAVLDQLRLATVVTDEHGEITFLSRAGQRILRKSQSQAAGRHWVEFFPFQEKEKAELKAMSERPTRRRTKVPAHMEVPGGCHYWFEVDVCDDPRDPRKKVFYLYDISDVHNLRRQMDDRDQFFDLIGGSESMQRLYQQIREVSSVDWTVLIEGETGSGKELVARAIHLASDRKGKPFIAVNCAGLLEALLASQLFGHRRGAFTGAVEDHLGFFEAASGGTLFLDEIGDVPMNIQSNLLRAIELKEITRLGESTTHKIDVRLLAATNRDLNLAVKEGTFRADLLYRIRVARILIPPLRERREDIPLLVGMFLGRCCAETGKQVWELNSEAMRMLSQYDWPGNVRELKATIECAVIHVKGSVIKPKDLPPEILASFQPGTNADDASRDEKQKIMDALKDAGGSRVRAARLLGMSRSTLYRRLAEISATPQK